MRRFAAFLGICAVTALAISATVPADSPVIEAPPDYWNLGRPSWATPLVKELEAVKSNPALVGDPTNVISGMMRTFPQVDFVLPGFHGPFEFSRKYYSTSEYEGPLGYGWTHCLNCTITRRNDQLFEIMTPEGKFNFFAILPGESTYVPFNETTSKLIRWTENANDPKPIYKMAWIEEDGTKYIFPDVMRAVMHVPRNVSAIEYGEGETLLFSPGDGSLPTEISASNGWEIRLSYFNRRITDIYEPGRPDNKPVHFEYENGNLISVTYPVDSTTTCVRRYFYEDSNDRHNLTRIMFERGDSFYYAYDAMDRCISSHGGEVAGKGGPYFNHVFNYYPDERKTIVTRVRGQEQFTDVYFYDSKDLIVRLDHVDSGMTKRFSYDIVPGAAVTIEEEIMNLSGDEYYKKVLFLDEKYDVVGMVQDMGGTALEPNARQPAEPTGQDRDYSNYPTPIAYLDFRSADFTYNILDMVTRIYTFNDTSTDALCEVMTFNYNADGTLREVHDSKERRATYSYDKEGKFTGVEPAGAPHPLMYSISNLRIGPPFENKHYEGTHLGMAEERDWLGRVTKITYLRPEGNVLSEQYVYNAADLYDADAKYGVNFFDVNGRKTQYLYDDAGLLWKVIEDMGEGRPNAVTSLRHDAFGNLISFSDPNGRTTTFAYDSQDRLISIRRPALPAVPTGDKMASLRIQTALQQNQNAKITGMPSVDFPPAETIENPL